MTPNRLAAPFATLLVVFGCSFVDPQAGAPQTACGISFGGSSASGSGTGYYGSGSASARGEPTCAASAGSPCNECENAHCCATRSACYGDPVCACADLALDECLDAAETSADEAAQRSVCWSTFALKGTVEQERVNCQRAWCQTACAVP